MSTQTYRLPDFLSLFPKKPGPEVNSHFKEVEASFRAWAEKSLAGDCATMMEEYYDTILSVAMVWPQSSYEWLMGVVNWNVAAFLIDDLMDRSPKDAPALVQLWMESLRDGKTIQHPQMEGILNDLAPSMRAALSPYHLPRFIRENEIWWLLPSIEEAHRREAYLSNGDTINIQEHLRIRRGTISMVPCLSFTRSNRCLYIPEEILAHPVIDEMTTAFIDVISITNDVYSFKKEYDFDKAFANILAVMRSDEETSHLDMQGALDRSGKMVKEAMERFHACARDLPSFNEEIDGYLASYVEGMIDMIVGNVQWSRICCRYNTFANEEDRRNNIVRWAL